MDTRTPFQFLLLKSGTLAMAVSFAINTAPAQAQWGLINFGISAGTSAINHAARHSVHYGSNVNVGPNVIDGSGNSTQTEPSTDSSSGQYVPSTSSDNTNSTPSTDTPAPGRTIVIRNSADRRRLRTANKAIDAYNKGARLSNSGDYTGAIASFKEALAVDPTLDITHEALGHAYKANHDYENAMPELQLALRKNHSNADLQYAIGDCARHMGDYKQSYDALQKYISMGGSGEKADLAKRTLEILDHNYFNQASGDYLLDATADGTARWDAANMPLKVWIDPNSTAKGYRPEFATLLKEAFTDWSNASQGRVRFAFTNKREEAQITCAWTDDMTKLGSLEELGLTHTAVDSNGIIKTANIDLFTMTDVPQNDQQLRSAKAVQLHEIGHALGMHHSQKPYDIMYAITCPEGLEFPLTARDKNTIMALYGDSSNIATAPAPTTRIHPHAHAIMQERPQIRPQLELPDADPGN